MGYVGIDNDDGGRGSDMGVALRGIARSRFFLTAKVNGGQTKAQTAAELEREHAALGVGVIDLILLHHPTPAPGLSLNETIQGQWAAVEEFYRSGRARSIGVSNFCPMAFAALFETALITPAVNQIMLHGGMGDDPDGVRTFALTHKPRILPMAYSALDQASAAILPERRRSPRGPRRAPIRRSQRRSPRCSRRHSSSRRALRLRQPRLLQLPRRRSV